MLMAGTVVGGISMPMLADEKADEEHIFGSELMTEEERNEYRERLREAKTGQERERIRAEHRKRMQECSRERNVPLKDKPAGGANHHGRSGPGGCCAEPWSA